MIDLKNKQNQNKPGANGDSNPKYRVMVVDDNKDILRTLE